MAVSTDNALAVRNICESIMTCVGKKDMFADWEYHSQDREDMLRYWKDHLEEAQAALATYLLNDEQRKEHAKMLCNLRAEWEELAWKLGGADILHREETLQMLYSYADEAYFWRQEIARFKSILARTNKTTK